MPHIVNLNRVVGTILAHSMNSNDRLVKQISVLSSIIRKNGLEIGRAASYTVYEYNYLNGYP